MRHVLMKKLRDGTLPHAVRRADSAGRPQGETEIPLCGRAAFRRRIGANRPGTARYGRMLCILTLFPGQWGVEKVVRGRL